MSKDTKIRREKAVVVATLLNTFIADLAATRTGFTLTEKAMEIMDDKIDSTYWNSLHRMHISHIAITMYKVCEVYKQYRYLIPESTRDEFKNLHNELEKRGALSIRNKLFGHILDKDTKEPVTKEVFSGYIDQFVQGEYGEFMNWVYNSKVSIFNRLEFIRSSFMEDYDISENEI